MDSLLESFRLIHEERERLVYEMVQELVYKKKNLNDEINASHRFKLHLSRYQDLSKRLIEMYEDNDGSKSEEIGLISGGNEFAEFYGRIRLVKEYHRKNPDYYDTMAAEYAELKKTRERNAEDLVEFTDEESYGKFLDLHSLYNQFINIKPLNNYERFQTLSYLDYLKFIDHLYDVPFDAKNHEDYLKYTNELFDYLLSYIQRSKPLLDLETIVTDHLRQFDTQWSCGDVPGWSMNLLNTIHQSSTNFPDPYHQVDFSKYNSAKQLEELGLDQLKEILKIFGLKCGGTLKERAERLFLLKDTPLNNLNQSYFACDNKNSYNTQYKSLEHYKSLALVETKIVLYLDVLKDELESTKDNVERKQARTAEEMLAEEDIQIGEEIIVSEEEEDYQDKTLYNPKNLPLDFDGKPIPYWLYRLHGLNVNYNCEICGNTKYRGPKAFQRHFGEWRHAHGMRCLGIPNTAHFVNVTKIQDAYNLWDVIKNTKIKEQWNPDNDEEYEDSDGNPINKKIYDDLRKQGLL